jgi:hypothetical protein
MKKIIILMFIFLMVATPLASAFNLGDFFKNIFGIEDKMSLSKERKGMIDEDLESDSLYSETLINCHKKCDDRLDNVRSFNKACKVGCNYYDSLSPQPLEGFNQPYSEVSCFTPSGCLTPCESEGEGCGTCYKGTVTYNNMQYESWASCSEHTYYQ